MAEDLFSRIQEVIVALDEDKLTALTDEVIKKGTDPIQAIQKGYAAGIRRVGELFEKGDYFLPELVGAANMVKNAIARVEKLIPRGKSVSKGVVVMGTVLGDIHDLGKTLVGTMLTANGFKVIDVGIDCPADKFIDAAVAERADLIGASTLLTMTAPEQKKLIECLTERGLRNKFKVMVGGAAVDAAWATEIGADGYGSDLTEAVEVAIKLIGKGKGG